VLRDRFGVSERRACTVVNIHRSTMRLTSLPVTAEETELRVWLRRFSTDRPRWGWRRAAKMARRAGWKVNNKRIRRLWRDEGLRVPQRRKKIASDRHWCRRWRDVTDSSERHLGDGFPVRHDRRWPHGTHRSACGNSRRAVCRVRAARAATGCCRAGCWSAPSPARAGDTSPGAVSAAPSSTGRRWPRGAACSTGQRESVSPQALRRAPMSE
jgi:HTH-like domain